MAEETKSGSGLDPKIAALIAYLLGIVGGIILLLIEKENKSTKFHAWQSIFLSLASIVVGTVLAITIVGIILLPLVYLGVIVLSIMAVVKAFNGEDWEMPVIGKLAKDQANK